MSEKVGVQVQMHPSFYCKLDHGAVPEADKHVNVP